MGEDSSGFTNEQSPRGWAFSGHLLDQKSKSPLFPGGGGRGWLQMTIQLLWLLLETNALHVSGIVIDIRDDQTLMIRNLTS